MLQVASEHVVQGAPFQVGDRVIVIASADDCGYPERIGQHGIVVQLRYETEVGDTYPGDPFISVVLDVDKWEGSFWKEELANEPIPV